MPYAGFTEEESRILDSSTDPQVTALLKRRQGGMLTPGGWTPSGGPGFSPDEQPLLLNALQQYQQRAGLEQGLAGAGLQGPYADTSRMMLGLQQKLSNPQLPVQRRGGGQAPQAPPNVDRDTGPNPFMPPQGPQPYINRHQEPRQPAAPPPEMPPEIRALQDALGAMQSRQGVLDTRKATINAAMGGPGSTSFLPTESLFSAQNLADRSTPEQVFNTVFHARYAKLTGQDAANLPTKDLAERIIGAWHRGDQETVTQDLQFLQSRASVANKVSRPRVKNAIHDNEDNTFKDLSSRVDLADAFGADPAKYGMTGDQFIRSFLSPEVARDVVRRLDAGEDPSIWIAEAKARLYRRAMDNYQQGKGGG